MEEPKVEEELKKFFDLVSQEELTEYHRIKDKIEKAINGDRIQDSPLENAGYYYGDSHPEYMQDEDITHLFINVSTELHHMNEECTELTNIEQINSIRYHVVVKPGIDPVNLAKDFTEVLDKSLDTSYVNIEKALEKNNPLEDK